MVTIRTQVKEILKDCDVGAEQISKCFMDKLDERVKELILDAAKRAKENNRKTVMGRDI